MMDDKRRLEFWCLLGVVLLLVKGDAGPCRRCRKPVWQCACPRLRYRTAGAWRGKGSFGSAPFGRQSGHRRR